MDPRYNGQSNDGTPMAGPTPRALAYDTLPVPLLPPIIETTVAAGISPGSTAGAPTTPVDAANILSDATQVGSATIITPVAAAPPVAANAATASAVAGFSGAA